MTNKDMTDNAPENSDFELSGMQRAVVAFAIEAAEAAVAARQGGCGPHPDPSRRVRAIARVVVHALNEYATEYHLDWTKKDWYQHQADSAIEALSADDYRLVHDLVAEVMPTPIRSRHPHVGIGDRVFPVNRSKDTTAMKYGFIRRQMAMLRPPIGGRHRYRVLHKFLVSRGWERERIGDPCWAYVAAYGGTDIALNPAELDVLDLADLGPLRPVVYLGEDDITVFSHGTWNGCEHHREQRWSFPHTKPDSMSQLRELIADVEQAARTAEARTYRACIVAGPCGNWLRQWRAQGGPWPGQPT